MCTWKPNVEAVCLFHSFFTLFFETGSLTDPGATHFSSTAGTVSPQDLPVSVSPSAGIWDDRLASSHLGFYVGAADLNSEQHT